MLRTHYAARSLIAGAFALGCSGSAAKGSGVEPAGFASGGDSSNGGTSGNSGTSGVSTSGGAGSSGASGAGGTGTTLASGGAAAAASGTGGVVASGGAPSVGGTSGETGGSGGEIGGSGGEPTASGGVSGASGGTSGGAGGSSSGACGGPSNTQPFGCKFAWGTNEPSSALSSYAYLDFISKWVGYEIAADGSFTSCDGCTWLSGMAQTSLVPVYYAYFIGYLGHANGLPDGNQAPNGPNLTTDAAMLIRKDRAALVSAYGEYARRSYVAWPTRPLVWLLEGDFVQYTDSTEKQALSYAELAQLASDITCAIKSNMPNAVVAINQSTWNADQVTSDYWGAMKTANVAYDLVWTTGVANNGGFFDASEDSTTYNHATATYAYVHTLTGKPIYVDTSFGLSAMADSWSGASAATLNARIAEGVVAANVTSPDANYASRLAALRPSLDAVCH